MLSERVLFAVGHMFRKLVETRALDVASYSELLLSGLSMIAAS